MEAEMEQLQEKISLLLGTLGVNSTGLATAPASAQPLSTGPASNAANTSESMPAFATWVQQVR